MGGGLGEYTGVVECTTRFNPSLYCVSIDGMTNINVEKEGNVVGCVNHRYINFNSIMSTILSAMKVKAEFIFVQSSLSKVESLSLFTLEHSTKGS